MPNRSSVLSRAPTVAAVIAASSLLALAACGSGDASSGAGAGTTITSGSGGSGGGTSTSSSSSTSGSSSSSSSGDPCGGCSGGATCGAANGLPICRAPTGVPVFSHVFVVMMENLSLGSLADDISVAPNLANLMSTYASGSDYHGVTHPSLPNYIALTSGDPQNITCDCQPDPAAGACSGLNCSIVSGSCGCNKAVDNLGDQLDKVGKKWRALGEGMGSPCNIKDMGSYAVRHVPFLYYDSIRNDAARCNGSVLDFAALDVSAAAPHLQFIAPNLTNDMHDPIVDVINGHKKNIANGDAFLGPLVTQIVASDAYKQGGLLVVVWDEDDFSGVPLPDDAIPIFVISPYAKAGGFVSKVKADHYALLATLEDAFGVPRLGGAMGAQPLTDYFPAK